MDSLQQFSRHVPQILRHQILLDLVKEYLRSDSHALGPTLSRGPSMQRFKGALLFIDISGFTVLSQKLDIESLKNNINEYFTKMLTIIQKWGGDVVKFAGDALYIVWQVRENGDGDSLDPPVAKREESKGLDAIDAALSRNLTNREAVDRAASCALEICTSCGAYEVKVQGPEKRGSTNAFQYKSASDNGADTDDVSYLDVHAGLSFGTMAGIDIGAENRWEFFLAGSPLADVAAAEEKAKKGDVVICKEAHELWHGSKDTVVDDEGKLLCGCRLHEECFYFVTKSDLSVVPIQALRRKSSRSRLSRKEGMKDIMTHGTRMSEDFVSEIESVYESIRPMLEIIYMKVVLGEEGISEDESLDSIRDDFDYFYENDGRRKFSNWMVKAMTDELAKHVHDVERKNHSFHEPYLKERFYDAVHHSIQFDRERSETVSAMKPGDLEQQQSFNAADEATQELGVDLTTMLPETRLQKSQYHNVFGGNTSIAAEIFLHSSEKRSLVTVMFVKIESITIEIHHHEGRRDHHDDHHLEKLLAFIPRSVEEYQEDVAALQRLQRCYCVLHEAIYSTEGQLRQFIIDDKGTVCIATFGLMGSVSVDNAASAIACAEKIILGLEGIDLNARIGVTTGEAYCGVVGSSIRHEYAVMGPSTNLSARLMCRAEVRSIICDETTYGQDRANKFILLDELKDVKGYSHPVKIFQPRSSVDLLNSNLIHDVAGKSVKTVRSAIITSKFVKGVYNVMKKNKKNVLFSIKIAKAKAKVRGIYKSEFVFLCEDRLKSPIREGDKNRRSSLSEKSTEVYRQLHGREDTIKTVFEAIIPSFGTIQNVIFEINSLCRMVVIGSSVGGGKSAILSAISLKLQHASENDPQLNFFLVSDNTFSKLRLKATVPLSYWGFILFDLLKIVATNFQMKVDTSLPPQEQSRLRYLHTFDSLIQQLPEASRDAKSQHLLLRLMKLDNALGKNTAAEAAAVSTAPSSNHHFSRDELEQLMNIIVHFVDLIPKIMNCAMILVLDDAHFLDSWSLRALHEVWQGVKGVCMILSFNPTQYHSSNMSMDTLSNQDSFMHTSSKSLMNKSTLRVNKKANVTQGDIFADYTDRERFVYIELPALKFEDTKLIAQDLLASNIELNEAEFRQLFDISNGNPLYTVELMYAIVANGGRADHSATHSKTTKNLSTLSFDSNGNVISTPTSRNRDLRVYFNKSKRLEEVIYYRLDQLHAHAQVLLKAASVAVSNGRSFSLELIYFMLEQNELLPTKAPALNVRKVSQKQSILNLASAAMDEDDSTYNNQTQDGKESSPNMHLAEHIIPFLIEHKIFIRVSQPRSPLPTTPSSSTAGNATNSNNPLPPPRASRLMQEQEMMNRLEQKKLAKRNKRGNNDNQNMRSSSKTSAFQFDLDSIGDVTVDDYDEDDDDENSNDKGDDDDDDLIPEHVKLSKQKRKLRQQEEEHREKLMTVYYEFIAPIEQSTIYGLITDDQRKYFHERVASFYRESLLDVHEVKVEDMTEEELLMSTSSVDIAASLNTDSKKAAAAVDTTTELAGASEPTNATSSVTFSKTVEALPSPSRRHPDLHIASVESSSNIDSPTKLVKLQLSAGESPENLLEEAFHWEKANFWSTALRTYMRSAELEKERENDHGWIVCLQHALRVYKTIEQEYYQDELPLMPNQKLPYPELIIKLLLGKNTKDTDVVLYFKSVEKDMNHVYEIFEHDMELIPLVCSMHLALADAYLLSWATLGEIATMAGVALKLMLALRYQEIFSFNNPNNSSTHSHRRRHSHGNMPNGPAGGLEHHSSHRSLYAAHHHSMSYMSGNIGSSVPTTPMNLPNVSPNSLFFMQSMNVSFNYRDLFNTKTFQADPHHLISTLHIIHNTVMRYERPDDRDGTYYYYIAFKMGELIVDVDDETQNICLKAMKGLRGKDYVKVADTIAPLLADSTEELTRKSKIRVRRFGVDLLPSIVSELAQSFFLTQEKHRFHELLERPLYDSLLRLPHLPSVENALLSYMVLLTYSEDFRLYRKMRSACKQLFVDRREQLVMIQGKFQEVVQCWARSFLALYCPEDVPIPQRDRITLSSMMGGIDMAEKVYESIQPHADPEEREMSSVEVKSLLRYGSTMESLALQIVCGLMMFVPADISYHLSPIPPPTATTGPFVARQFFASKSSSGSAEGIGLNTTSYNSSHAHRPNHLSSDVAAAIAITSAPANGNSAAAAATTGSPRLFLHAISETDEHDHEHDHDVKDVPGIMSNDKVSAKNVSESLPPPPVANSSAAPLDRASMFTKADSTYSQMSYSDMEIAVPGGSSAATTPNGATNPNTSPFVEPPTASYVDDLFSLWWDRMFTDLYTLRYLHILNILNPLLLLSRVLAKHQPHLSLPYTEARILLFYARFKTEIIHVCKKHKYLVAMEKFLAVEQLFVDRRKERGGRVRSLSSPSPGGGHNDASNTNDNFVVQSNTQLNSHSASNHNLLSPIGSGDNNTATNPNGVEFDEHSSSNMNMKQRPVLQPKRTLYKRTFTPRSLQEIIRTVERKSHPAMASNSPLTPPVPPNAAAADADAGSTSGRSPVREAADVSPAAAQQDAHNHSTSPPHGGTSTSTSTSTVRNNTAGTIDATKTTSDQTSSATAAEDASPSTPSTPPPPSNTTTNDRRSQSNVHNNNNNNNNNNSTTTDVHAMRGEVRSTPPASPSIFSLAYFSSPSSLTFFPSSPSTSVTHSPATTTSSSSTTTTGANNNNNNRDAAAAPSRGLRRNSGSHGHSWHVRI